MNNTWQNTVSAAPTRKTCWAEVISLWSIKWKVTSIAGLQSALLVLAALINIVFTQRGVTIRPITGWVADEATVDLYFKQWGQQ